MSPSKNELSSWWIQCSFQRSKKHATPYREKTHWMLRLDAWPFFLVLYPSLLIYISHCLAHDVFHVNILQRFHRNVDFSKQLFIYGITFLLTFCHIVSHLATYWNLKWNILMRYTPLRNNAGHPTHLLIHSSKPQGNLCFSPVVPCSRVHQDQFLGKVECFKKWYLFDNAYVLYSLYYPCDARLTFYTNLAKCSIGLNDSHVAQLQEIYGTNNFDIANPSFMALFKEHIVAPFFAFQVFCLFLWLLDDYRANSLITLALLVFLESQLVLKRLHELAQLRDMRVTPIQIYVWRKEQWRIMSSDSLLPGDVIALPCTKASGPPTLCAPEKPSQNMLCPCDALLISGTVMVNEATLSGESLPQCKVAIHVDKGNESTTLDIKSLHKQHSLYAGTSIISMESSYNKAEQVTHQPLPSHAKLCCIVLKTGFETTQGKIVRTVLYSSERVTVENKEALYFLLLLLFCAILASGYVLWNSLSDAISPHGRSLYKLLLNCIMIITSVVPPEFPITMSMAVTLSLVQLGRKKIFCTEPFRLPYAGRTTICAFDKTGTLTKDEMEIRGVVGCLSSRNSLDVARTFSESNNIDDVLSLSRKQSLLFCSRAVLVACNSLVYISDQSVMGDGVEKACMDYAGAWTMKSSHTFIHKHTQFFNTLTVIRRFPFASELRRMTVVVHHSGLPFKDSTCQLPEDKEPKSSNSFALVNDNELFSTPSGYYVLCKGSPEVLYTFLSSIPSYFNSLLQLLNRHGYRVLALGCKKIEMSGGSNSKKLLQDTPREALESSLTFAGFLVLSSGIKQGTITSLTRVLQADYKAIMITGDHPLTACQTALEAKMIPCAETSSDLYRLLHSVVVCPENHVQLVWTCRNTDHRITTSSVDEILKLKKKYILCLSGSQLEELQKLKQSEYTRSVISATTIFARMAPAQKEEVISMLKQQNQTILMCGDGTNDVAALKAAQIGISLLSGSECSQNNKKSLKQVSQKPIKHMTFTERLKAYEQENFMDLPLPSLGMASYASPFSYRGGTIRCVPIILRYGRATLATVMMSYKIMAINALITAFSLSVLTLDGVKLGDLQTTLESLYISILVFISSKAKPAENLTPGHCETTLFTPSILICIFGQAFTHLLCLLLGWKTASRFRPHDYNRDVDGEFIPNLTNTVEIKSLTSRLIWFLQVVFLILSCTHGCTFLVNYSGLPNLLPLSQHTLLRQSLLLFFLILCVMILEIFPPLNQLFSLVPFPNYNLKLSIIGLILLDVMGSYVFGRVLFG